MQTPDTLPRAIVLTGGMLRRNDAKTAHGLIRGTERFHIAAVVDAESAGLDAGEVLDGRWRNIPVYADVEQTLAHTHDVQYCIVGVATIGGVLPAELKELIINCIKKGISVVNGLHDYLNDMPDVASLAAAHGVSLIDVRRPKKIADLHFWTGKIFEVEAPIIAVIGTDCALGKRTTCRMIREACRREGINAQMIYTGQTGWMQGGRHGLIFDSTLNDFLSGEIEHAIYSCWQETGAELILIEGQSALRNPSGPGGSEFLISGNAKYVVLVHAPKRRYYEDIPEWGEIPPMASEIALIKMYGAAVVALALNTEHCSSDEARAFQKQFAAELNIPVLLPLEEGVEAVLPVLQRLSAGKNGTEK